MDQNEIPEDKLTNVHSALAEASLESKNEKAMKNFSVRMPKRLKIEAQAVCSRHGTDLGTFLRKCAEGLIADYGIDVTE